MTPEIFSLKKLKPIKKFCQISKKNCRRHFAWDRMYRAEIDIKRIRNLVRLDENLDARKKLEFNIRNRFGSALLLHNETIRHTELTDLRPIQRIEETEEKVKIEFKPEMVKTEISVD